MIISKLEHSSFSNSDYVIEKIESVLADDEFIVESSDKLKAIKKLIDAFDIACLLKSENNQDVQ